MHQCEFCKRVMKVTDEGYAQNPFCVHCGGERLAKAQAESTEPPSEWVRDGRWFKRVPIPPTPGGPESGDER